MIAQISGKLLGLDGSAALIQIGEGIVYEVLLPTFVVNRLGPLIGRSVHIYTLHFLESQAQGATFIPRLAGFLSRQDKAFFELFTTVKGIGNRKALRAMALASHQIAAAIADRDAKTLQSLPEIGKRTAETIIVTLKDKVEPYVAPSPQSIQGDTDYVGFDTVPPQKASLDKSAESKSSNTPAKLKSATSTGSLIRDALGVLTELGENRITAMQRIDHIMTSNNSDEPAPTTVDQVIAAYYRAINA